MRLQPTGTLLLYTAPKMIIEREIIVVFRTRGADVLQFTCSNAATHNGTAAETIITDLAEYFRQHALVQNKDSLLHLFNVYAAHFNLASAGYVIKEKTTQSFTDKLRAITKPKDLGSFFPFIFTLNFILLMWGIVKGAGFFSFDTEFLYNSGALYLPDILRGEYYRLLLSMFLHDGVGHFMYNMIALVYALTFLKDYLKPWAIFMVYIASGVIGSGVSLWYHPDIMGVGASGAIFGLYGIVISFSFFGTADKTEARGAAVIIGIMGGISLIAGLKEGVDNAAHIGGLLGGAACGALMQPLFRFRNSRVFGTLYPVVALPFAAVVVFVLLKNTDLTPAKYQDAMSRFEHLEETGMLYYKDEIKNGTDSLRIAVLRDSCMPAWYTAKEVLNEALQLRGLNMDQSIRIERLLRYCDLRIATTSILLWYYTDDKRYNVHNSDSVFTALTRTLDTLNDKVVPGK